MGKLGVCKHRSVSENSRKIGQDSFFSSADLNTQNRCCVLSAVLLQENGIGQWGEMWSNKVPELRKEGQKDDNHKLFDYNCLVTA